MGSAVTVVALLVIALVASARDAWAYIDPGSGSFLLQAIVGGIAAIAVFAGHVWRRITRPLRRKTPNGERPMPHDGE